MTEEVLIHRRDLCCLKFSLEEINTPKEDLQVKEVLETSMGPEFRDW